jgi:hypothetical protein
LPPATITLLGNAQFSRNMAGGSWKFARFTLS